MSNRPITFSYHFVPTLKAFALSNKRHRYVKGPFGSGKSSAMLWELIRRAHQQRPGSDGMRKFRAAIVRNSYIQLKDTTIKTVLDWLPPSKFGQYKSADHEYIITGFDGIRIELLFRALDRPEQVSNLLSLELTMAWFNEFREMPKSIVDAMDGRLNRYPSQRDGGCTFTGIIGDTNPYEEDSEWQKYLEVDAIEGDPEIKAITELWSQPSGLGPEAENIIQDDAIYAEWRKAYEEYRVDYMPGLVPDYYTSLAVGKSKEYVDVYIHGKNGFVKEGRTVYENTWNDSLHMSKSPLSPIMGRELVIGCDFGLTPAAIIGQLTPRGFFNVLREITSDGMGFQQFLRNRLKPILRTEFPDYPILLVGDPAGQGRSQSDERTCFEVAHDEGFKIVSASSNDLVARTGAVEFFLSRMTDGQPAFRLDPSCKILRKGFNKGYYFRKIRTNEERYTPDPVKNNYSHPHDALQYLAMHLSGDIVKAQKHRPVNTPKRRPSTYAGY